MLFFLSTGESSLGSTRNAFYVQLNLIQAIAGIVLAIAWSPLILAILDGVGYFNN